MFENTGHHDQTHLKEVLVLAIISNAAHYFMFIALYEKSKGEADCLLLAARKHVPSGSTDHETKAGLIPVDSHLQV